MRAVDVLRPPTAGHRYARLAAIVLLSAAPIAGGLAVLAASSSRHDAARLRTFGGATVEVPKGWEAPPSRARPDQQEAFEMRRLKGGELVAAAVLLNATFDLEAASAQNGGVVLNRASRQVGGQPAVMVESTNLTQWRYLDVLIPSAGLSVSLRWDPRVEDRREMERVLDGLSLSQPSRYDGPVPALPEQP